MESIVGFGANEGEPASLHEVIADRLRQLDRVVDVRTSPLYRTAAVGGPEQPAYINGAYLIHYRGGGQVELLQDLHTLEREFGRQRSVRWGPRPIDLDILMSEGAAWCILPELLVPHPRFFYRWFAVAPAADLAPDWRHTFNGQRLRDLRRTLERPGRLLIIADEPVTRELTRRARAAGWGLAQHYLDRMPTAVFRHADQSAQGAYFEPAVRADWLQCLWVILATATPPVATMRFLNKRIAPCYDCGSSSVDESLAQFDLFLDSARVGHPLQ